MANLIGNTIVNNFDRFTGEPFNATLIYTFPDASPIADADVDNTVVFKNTAANGGGYSLRDNWNNIKLSNTPNTQASFVKIVANINKLGGGRIIMDKMLAITSNITIPAPVELDFMRGGGLNVSSGVIVTISSDVNTKTQRIAYGNGNVLFAANGEIWTDAFGTVPDTGTDQQPFFQKAIDSCKKTTGNMRTRGGRYLIHSPLLLGRDFNGTSYFGDPYVSLKWYGIRPTTSAFVGTSVIEATFTDCFALGILSGRNVSINDIRIEGQNIIPTSTTMRWDEYEWVLSGVRDSLYSPYSAIVVDPFTTTVPADGGYPGFGAYYADGASQSAGTKFNNVVINNFVVGFLITPAQNTSGPLGSEITWTDCTVARTKVGVSSCNTQNRNLFWYGGAVNICQYDFDTATYGARTGNIPRIYGVNASGKYLFNAAGQTGEQVIKVYGLHAESVAAIGFIGTSNSPAVNTAKLEDCRFNFSGQSTNGETRGSVDFHVVNYGNLELVGCTIEVRNFRVYQSPNGSITYRNCMLIGFNGEPSITPNTPNNTIIEDCKYRDLGGTFTDIAPIRHTVMSNKLTPNELINTSTSFNRNHLVMGQVIIPQNINRLIISNNPTTVIPLGSHALSTFIESGTKKASFSVSSEWVGRIKRFSYLMCTTNVSYENFDGTNTLNSTTNIIGTVDGFNEDTLTVTIMNVPFAIQNGATYAMSIVSWGRFHMQTFGDTTSGNNIISGISPQAMLRWAAGDRIKGAGIPTGAYVVSTDSSAGTFTISVNATATASGVSLYDAPINEFNPTLSGTTAGRPSAPTVGQEYLNITTGRPEWWNGTNWVSDLQAAASADTAPSPGATYNQSEAAAILDELRDLKAKMRAAGLLDT